MDKGDRIKYEMMRRKLIRSSCYLGAWNGGPACPGVHRAQTRKIRKVFQR